MIIKILLFILFYFILFVGIMNNLSKFVYRCEDGKMGCEYIIVIVYNRREIFYKGLSIRHEERESWKSNSEIKWDRTPVLFHH